MSLPDFIIRDFYEVHPSEDILNLSKRDKFNLMDSALNIQDSSGTRGLKITLDMSHGGRRINNRIYPPLGQKAGVASWMGDHGKGQPVLMHHDRKQDPIGRVQAVRWVSLEDQAIKFFSNINDFMDVKSALEDADPQAVYRTLRKHKLLTNRKWPGLSKLEADVRITDEAAVEKFLDGRYLTFSAGTISDRYACGLCGSDWYVDGPCEHRPGSITDESEIGTIVTGKFIGKELSVVNDPADTLAYAHTMEFTDSDNTLDLQDSVDPSTIYITDAIVSMPGGTTMSVQNSDGKLQGLLNLEMHDLLTEDNLNTLIDAIAGDTHTEKTWLIRIHDALHAQWDYRLRYMSPDEDEDASIPSGIFKLHGAIHETSLSKDFRDDLVNGKLDSFDEVGGESTKYRLAGGSEDSSELAALTDAVTQLIATLQQPKTAAAPVADDADDASQETGDAATNEAEVSDGDESSSSGVLETQDQTQEETQEEGETQEEVNSDEDASTDAPADDGIDWAVLDLALNSVLDATAPDAKLSTDDRDKLEESQFCGPDRSFPVADAAYATAAKHLIEKAKLSDEQKALLLARVDEKEKAFVAESNDAQTDETGTEDPHEQLKLDHAEALKLADSYRIKLEAVLEAHATSQQVTLSDNENDARLDTLYTWFSNIGPEESTSSDDDAQTPNTLAPVDNPSVGVDAGQTDQKKLSAFEQTVVNDYIRIRDESGDDAANQFYLSKRRYLSRNFNPNNYS